MSDDTASRAAAMRIQCDIEGRKAKTSDEPSDEWLDRLAQTAPGDLPIGDEWERVRNRAIYNAGKEAGRASMQRELEEVRRLLREAQDDRDEFEATINRKFIGEQSELSQARSRIAALEAGQDYCWHCRVGLMPAAKHCERCPAPGDCDDEDCQEDGCVEAKAPREAELVTATIARGLSLCSRSFIEQTVCDTGEPPEEPE